MDSIDKKLLLIEAYMIALGENLKSAKEYFADEIEDAVYDLEERAAIQDLELTEEQEAAVRTLKETDMPGYFDAMRKIRSQYSEGEIVLAQQKRVEELRERIEETERNKTALERSPKYNALIDAHFEDMAAIREAIRQQKVMFYQERDAYFAFAIVGLHELQRRQAIDPERLDDHAEELEVFLRRAITDCLSVSPKDLIKTYKRELQELGINLN
ncbi:hypothetical protein KY310_04460 [Candidatus Woesearchaeota archaeon]|nr:hypothetical protein [Candidatus Woesearchaeota archaeon]